MEIEYNYSDNTESLPANADAGRVPSKLSERMFQILPSTAAFGRETHTLRWPCKSLNEINARSHSGHLSLINTPRSPREHTASTTRPIRTRRQRVLVVFLFFFRGTNPAWQLMNQLQPTPPPPLSTKKKKSKKQKKTKTSHQN